MRACDLDQSGDVWLYRPESHKFERSGPAHEPLVRTVYKLVWSRDAATRTADAGELV